MRSTLTTVLIITFMSFQSCAGHSDSSAQNIPSAETDVQPANESNSTPAQQQPEWKTQDDPLYSIQYPGGWEVNYTGKPGISMAAIASKESKSDKFRENMMLVEDSIKDKTTDLKSLAEKYTAQVIDRISDSKLVEDTEKENGAGTYREVVYTTDQAGSTLLCTQRFFIHNGRAFILSFTYQKDKANQYSPIRDQIFESFKLK